MEETSVANKSLDLLEDSLIKSIAQIDELHGRLEEVTHHLPVESIELSDESKASLEELHDLYLSLPVWSAMEEFANKVNKISKEIAESKEIKR